MLKKALFFIALISILCLIAVTALAEGPSSATKAAQDTATYITAAFTLIFLAAAILLVLHDKNGFMGDMECGWFPVTMVIIIAIAVRVFVALNYEGYRSDINCFKSWSTAAYEQGTSNFYTSGMFADYPPGYMYVLYVLGWIKSILGIGYSSSLFTLFIKIPSIIAETITAVIAYRLAKKHVGSTFGCLAAILVMFNPAMFFNSSVWGQIDAVFVLFIILTIIFLKKEKFMIGALFYALSMLIKPQAILFAPVIGLAFLYSMFKKQGTLKAILKALGSAVVFAAVIFAASLPFKGSQGYDWIIGRYIASTQTYELASLNAFNLYSLLGANFKSYFEPFLFLTYQKWGYIFIILICAVIVFLQWRSRKQRPFFDLSAFLMLSVFMLAHAMHERYIVPVFVCLVFSYLYSRDVKTLFFAYAFTITALLGQMFTLYSDSTAAAHLPTIIVSAVNCALYLVYAILTIRKYASNKILIKPPAMYG